MLFSWKTHKSKRQLRAEIEKDFLKLESVLPQVEQATLRLESLRSTFAARTVGELSHQAKRDALEAWASFLELHNGLLLIVESYRRYYLIPYFFAKELHALAFALHYCAYVTAYASCVRFFSIVHGNDLFDLILNERREELGIPRNGYADMKWRIIHFSGAWSLAAGYGNYQFLKSVLAASPTVRVHAWIIETIERFFTVAKDALGENAMTWFPKNAANIFRARTEEIIFPTQKIIAEALGNTRIGPRDTFLINDTLLHEVRPLLLPLDVLLERRNWYLSNVGIPGFWPHAALYIGTFDECVRHFDTKEVREYLHTKGFANISSALDAANASFFNEYRKGQLDVIEARSAGVILNTFEASAHADYLGVVRPHITTVQRLESLLEAVRHFGKPYDYRFDFVRDEAVVCSELVFRAFRDHLPFSLESHAGRMVFPPTAFASHPHFTCVAFIDASESEHHAFLSTPEEFAKTPRRPKWDIAQS